jgi:hypothetical protein
VDLWFDRNGVLLSVRVLGGVGNCVIAFVRKILNIVRYPVIQIAEFFTAAPPLK